MRTHTLKGMHTRHAIDFVLLWFASVSMALSGSTLGAQEGAVRTAHHIPIDSAFIGQNVLPVDTGPLRSGWQDFSRYNLGMCRSAARVIQRNVVQGFRQVDTLPYSLAMHEPIAPQALRIARQCAGAALSAGPLALPVANVDTVYEPLLELALMVQPDDSVLALLTARQVRFATPDAQVNFLYEELKRVLHARPVRVALLDTLVTRIDAFGESPGALRWRWRAHVLVVLEHWMRLGDFAVSQPAIDTALQLYRRMAAAHQAVDRNDVEQLWRFLFVNTMAEDGPNGPIFTAMRRQMQDFYQGQYDDSWLIAPWRWLGKSLVLPPVAYWFPNTMSSRPVSGKPTSARSENGPSTSAVSSGYTPGRVTLFIRHSGFGTESAWWNPDHNWEEAAVVRRLATRFKGQGLDIVWLDKTRGFSYRSLTQTPAQEAEARRHIWLEWIKLPVTMVGIEETPMDFAPPPNFRRVNGATAIERTLNYSGIWGLTSPLSTWLVDEHGTIRFLTTSFLKYDETAIEAGITRVLRR